ncbi:hypothetical protein TYRP_002418 [Tyrophagus putrescentiae]|nr:hypothetical protein TYRP_002418 [Tyrophagus putrescentiae]
MEVLDQVLKAVWAALTAASISSVVALGTLRQTAHRIVQVDPLGGLGLHKLSVDEELGSYDIRLTLHFDKTESTLLYSKLIRIRRGAERSAGSVERTAVEGDEALQLDVAQTDRLAVHLEDAQTAEVVIGDAVQQAPLLLLHLLGEAADEERVLRVGGADARLAHAQLRLLVHVQRDDVLVLQHLDGVPLSVAEAVLADSTYRSILHREDHFALLQVQRQEVGLAEDHRENAVRLSRSHHDLHGELHPHAKLLRQANMAAALVVEEVARLDAVRTGRHIDRPPVDELVLHLAHRQPAQAAGEAGQRVAVVRLLGALQVALHLRGELLGHAADVHRRADIERGGRAGRGELRRRLAVVHVQPAAVVLPGEAHLVPLAVVVRLALQRHHAPPGAAVEAVVQAAVDKVQADEVDAVRRGNVEEDAIRLDGLELDAEANLILNRLGDVLGDGELEATPEAVAEADLLGAQHVPSGEITSFTCCRDPGNGRQFAAANGRKLSVGGPSHQGQVTPRELGIPLLHRIDHVHVRLVDGNVADAAGEVAKGRAEAVPQLGADAAHVERRQGGRLHGDIRLHHVAVGVVNVHAHDVLPGGGAGRPAGQLQRHVVPLVVVEDPTHRLPPLAGAVPQHNHPVGQSPASLASITSRPLLERVRNLKAACSGLSGSPGAGSGPSVSFLMACCTNEPPSACSMVSVKETVRTMSAEQPAVDGARVDLQVLDAAVEALLGHLVVGVGAREAAQVDVLVRRQTRLEANGEAHLLVLGVHIEAALLRLAAHLDDVPLAVVVGAVGDQRRHGAAQVVAERHMAIVQLNGLELLADGVADQHQQAVLREGLEAEDDKDVLLEGLCRRLLQHHVAVAVEAEAVLRGVLVHGAALHPGDLLQVPQAHRLVVEDDIADGAHKAGAADVAADADAGRDAAHVDVRPAGVEVEDALRALRQVLLLCGALLRFDRQLDQLAEALHRHRVPLPVKDVLVVEDLIRLPGAEVPGEHDAAAADLQAHVLQIVTSSCSFLNFSLLLLGHRLRLCLANVRQQAVRFVGDELQREFGVRRGLGQVGRAVQLQDRVAAELGRYADVVRQVLRNGDALLQLADLVADGLLLSAEGRLALLKEPRVAQLAAGGVVEAADVVPCLVHLIGEGGVGVETARSTAHQADHAVQLGDVLVQRRDVLHQPTDVLEAGGVDVGDLNGVDGRLDLGEAGQALVCAAANRPDGGRLVVEVDAQLLQAVLGGGQLGVEVADLGGEAGVQERGRLDDAVVQPGHGLLRLAHGGADVVVGVGGAQRIGGHRLGGGEERSQALRLRLAGGGVLHRLPHLPLRVRQVAVHGVHGGAQAFHAPAQLLPLLRQVDGVLQLVDHGGALIEQRPRLLRVVRRQLEAAVNFGDHRTDGRLQGALVDALGVDGVLAGALPRLDDVDVLNDLGGEELHPFYLVLEEHRVIVDVQLFNAATQFTQNLPDFGEGSQPLRPLQRLIEGLLQLPAQLLHLLLHVVQLAVVEHRAGQPEDVILHRVDHRLQVVGVVEEDVDAVAALLTAGVRHQHPPVGALFALFPHHAGQTLALAGEEVALRRAAELFVALAG